MARYEVKRRRMGTVHIIRWWEVWRDGEFLDAYEDRSLAEGYVKYMNERLESRCSRTE